jgi:sodium transport system permease protein
VNIILVIARKEFMDVLRDRRTLLFMLLLPIVVMPLLMVVGARVAKSQAQEKESRALTVAIEPAARERVRSLADRWMKDNKGALIGAALRMGIQQLGGLDDLGRLVERAEALRDAPRNGDADDAAFTASLQAFLDLSESQSQLLADAAAVRLIVDRVKWVDVARIGGIEILPQGVLIPPGLPADLARPALAVAISGKAKAVHAAIDLPANVYDRLEESAVSVPITILFDSSQSLSKEAADRFRAFAGALERSEMNLRLNRQKLSPAFIRPFDIRSANLASDSRKLQAVLGSVLPYLIILFCFFGAFYPSLDLTAGEKERFTLETLLLAPVTRLEIAAGKFIVVFAAAIIAAVLATTSMAVTLTHGVLPAGSTEVFNLEFQPLAVILTASLLLPVAALFAALLLGISLLARSFKEAQTCATPLQFLVILPAIAAMLPDLETELKWAWVPLMNVSLLMKELLKGNYLWEFYLITLSSTVTLACIVLWGAGMLFRRESVLLRS